MSRPALEIGVLDGREEEVFGRIRDVVVDSAGNFFVLDQQSRDLRWFGPDGSFRGRAGGAGSGPGELRSAFAISLDSAGHVHVVDPVNGRISEYEPTPSGLIPAGQVALPQWAINMCFLGSRLYLLVSPTSGTVVQEIDQSGKVLRDFGMAVEPDPESLRLLPEHRPVLTDASNRGRLICDQRSQRIILVHSEVPIVRAFSPEGDELWRTVMADYDPIRYVPGTRPRSIQAGASPTTTAHNAAAATVSARGELIVTLHEWSVANLAGRLEGRVFDLMTGAEIARRNIPVAVAAVRGRSSVGFVQYPFPQVRVYQSPLP